MCLPSEFRSLCEAFWYVGVEEEELGAVLLLVQFYGHRGIVGWEGEGLRVMVNECTRGGRVGCYRQAKTFLSTFSQSCVAFPVKKSV